MKPEFLHDQREERVGRLLIKNLEARIKLCNEISTQDMPLPCFTRSMMQRLMENENELDELIAETVMELMNERSPT